MKLSDMCNRCTLPWMYHNENGDCPPQEIFAPAEKLSPQQKQALKLIGRSCNADGYCRVSDAVWPLVVCIPEELIILEKQDKGGIAQLRYAGKVILKYT